MFDTMTLTKATGAVCGSLLVFMLLGWAGSSLYATGAGGHGHDEEVAQAYSIEVVGGAADAEPEEEVPFAEIYASADPAVGERSWSKCRACHHVDGTDGTGPHLNGVVDRAKAAVAGYAYSPVLAGMADEAWTPENLSAFLQNPRGYAQGTKMAFAGIPSVEERANLIAWLATQP